MESSCVKKRMPMFATNNQEPSSDQRLYYEMFNRTGHIGARNWMFHVRLYGLILSRVQQVYTGELEANGHLQDITGRDLANWCLKAAYWQLAWFRLVGLSSFWSGMIMMMVSQALLKYRATETEGHRFLNEATDVFNQIAGPEHPLSKLSQALKHRSVEKKYDFKTFLKEEEARYVDKWKSFH